MDCGPAALKCLLEGFGIGASYGRLREACQTDVDGTSIDTLEDVANALGLIAQQSMLPMDHYFLLGSDAPPALAVAQLPNGFAHFIVVWRNFGPVVQIMDPAVGRQFVPTQQLRRRLYVHQHPVPADAWRTWAGSDDFCDPLGQRLQALEIEETARTTLLDAARADKTWCSLAALDATTRMVNAMVRARGLRAGAEAGGVLERIFRRAQQELLPVPPDAEHDAEFSAELDAEAKPVPATTIPTALVPQTYWSVFPPAPEQQLPENTLFFRGVVLVQIFGRRDAAVDQRSQPAPAEDAPEIAQPPTTPDTVAPTPGAPPAANLSPELSAALEEPAFTPWQILWRTLRTDGLWTPALLLVALAVATFNILVEAVILRGFLEIGQSLHFVTERLDAALFLAIFLLGMLLLEIPQTALVQRLGRGLETRLRVQFLSKLPRLSDRYFHSRLTSDMTQRAYELRQLRTLPPLVIRGARLFFQIVLTTAGVIWIYPGGAGLALLAAGVAVAFSLLSQPLRVEQDLVQRTHTAALSRFYLDALLGLVPIRTHSAQAAVRHEHESLLVEWLRASRRLYRTDILLQFGQGFLGAAFAFGILYSYLANGGEPGGILLLFYWTLQLPALGQALAAVAQQIPMQRNRLLRLLEPLSAPDETTSLLDPLPEPTPHQPSINFSQNPAGTRAQEPVAPDCAHAPQGAAIRLTDLAVRAGGHVILEKITLSIQAGEHVAIIGPSGAGKSTLAGLLLGWHRPAAGELRVDDLPLSGPRLLALRRQTAWVDPAVQLWNRSLIQNLTYGSAENDSSTMGRIIEQADLVEVLERLPQGLQSQLGEGGGLLSGGEGQRVRLGRAMRRSDVRLVILDEPFRGLDRAKRRDLLARARAYWADVTLLFISHDVGQTQDFARVLVVEDGHLVEDAAPQQLLADDGSRYRAFLDAEEAVRRGLWNHEAWRRLWLEAGQLTETPTDHR